VLLVKITEEDLASFAYRSPVDREFLSNLISRIDQNGPSVIGIDLLFDQPTEVQKDNALLDAINQIKSEVVLASVNDKYPATQKQRTYMAKMKSETKARNGLINMISDIDGVIRRLPQTSSGSSLDTFSGQIVSAHGKSFNDRVKYWEQISWLKQPKDKTDIFLETSAGFYLATPELASAWTENKIVIIGAELLDSDNHRTPFLILGKEMKLTSGVEIHGQIIAQRLDDRRVKLLPTLLEYLAYLIAIFAAIQLFRKYNQIPRLAKVSGYLGIVLIVLDAIFFRIFSTILPTAMIVMCFSTVITVCYFAKILTKRDIDSS